MLVRAGEVVDDEVVVPCPIMILAGIEVSPAAVLFVKPRWGPMGGIGKGAMVALVLLNRDDKWGAPGGGDGGEVGRSNPGQFSKQDDVGAKVENDGEGDEAEGGVVEEPPPPPFPLLGSHASDPVIVEKRHGRRITQAYVQPQTPGVRNHGRAGNLFAANSPIAQVRHCDKESGGPASCGGKCNRIGQERNSVDGVAGRLY